MTPTPCGCACHRMEPGALVHGVACCPEPAVPPSTNPRPKRFMLRAEVRGTRADAQLVADLMREATNVPVTVWEVP